MLARVAIVRTAYALLFVLPFAFATASDASSIRVYFWDQESGDADGAEDERSNPGLTSFEVSGANDDSRTAFTTTSVNSTAPTLGSTNRNASISLYFDGQSIAAEACPPGCRTEDVPSGPLASSHSEVRVFFEILEPTAISLASATASLELGDGSTLYHLIVESHLSLAGSATGSPSFSSLGDGPFEFEAVLPVGSYQLRHWVLTYSRVVTPINEGVQRRANSRAVVGTKIRFGPEGISSPTVTSPTLMVEVVPEPSTAILIATGVAGLALSRIGLS